MLLKPASSILSECDTATRGIPRGLSHCTAVTTNYVRNNAATRQWYLVCVILNIPSDIAATVATLPYGNVIATCRGGNIVHVFDTCPTLETPTTANAARPKLLHTFQTPNGLYVGPAEIYKCVSFSPSGEFIAGAKYNSIYVFRTPEEHNATGNTAPLYSIRVSCSEIHSMKYSPSGEHIASASADGSIRVYHTNTRELCWERKGHDSNATCLAYSTCGVFLAAGGTCGNVVVLDAGSGAVLHQVRGHSAAVWTLCFSPEGSILLSGGADHALHVWEVSHGTLTLTHSITKHPTAVYCACFDPFGTTVAVALDNVVRLCDTGTWEHHHLRLVGKFQCVQSLAYSPDGRMLATGHDNNTAILWDVDTGATLHTIVVGASTESWVYSVCFSPDGSRIAHGRCSDRIHLWSVPSRKDMHVKTVRFPEGMTRTERDPFQYIGFSSNANYLCVLRASRPNVAAVADLRDPRDGTNTTFVEVPLEYGEEEEITDLDVDIACTRLLGSQ